MANPGMQAIGSWAGQSTYIPGLKYIHRLWYLCWAISNPGMQVIGSWAGLERQRERKRERERERDREVMWMKALQAPRAES